MITIHPVLAGTVKIGILQVNDVRIRETPEHLRRLTTNLAISVQKKYVGTPPGGIKAMREVRRLLHHTGLDPTRYRPSSEALFRRVVRGKDLFFC